MTAGHDDDSSPPRAPLRIAMLALTFAGLLLAGALAVRQGLGSVAGVLASVGWGLPVIIGIHLLQVLMSALGWRAALGPAASVDLPWLFGLRWIREAVNSILPVAQVGGEVVGARLLTMRGIRSEVAAASVVVDVTYEFVTQALFTMIGLAVFLAGNHEQRFDRWLVLGAVAGLPLALSFIVVQRRGAFHHVERFLNWIARRLPIGLSRIEGLHDTLQHLYSNPRHIVAGCLWHLMSWLAGAVEIWVILQCVGEPRPLTDGLILEAMGQAVRSAAFLVPGAFGVQEGGYLLLGSMIGLPPSVGLGISLAKRIREFTLGAVGFVAWHWLEGRRLVTGTRRVAPPNSTGE